MLRWGQAKVAALLYAAVGVLAKEAAMLLTAVEVQATEAALHAACCCG
jgi:hypothetical protein